MPRDINYNMFKGDAHDIEDIFLDIDALPKKVQKIKKKKRFDDGTVAKPLVDDRNKDIFRKNSKKL